MWLGFLRPDDYSQAEIVQAYSRYGGSFGNSLVFAVGNSNGVVYDVRGGMEDWAYAASWDPSMQPKYLWWVLF